MVEELLRLAFPCGFLPRLFMLDFMLSDSTHRLISLLLGNQISRVEQPASWPCRRFLAWLCMAWLLGGLSLTRPHSSEKHGQPWSTTRKRICQAHAPVPLKREVRLCSNPATKHTLRQCKRIARCGWIEQQEVPFPPTPHKNNPSGRLMAPSPAQGVRGPINPPVRELAAADRLAELRQAATQKRLLIRRVAHRR